MNRVLAGVTGIAIACVTVLSGCGTNTTTQSTTSGTGVQGNPSGGNLNPGGPRARGFGGGMQLSTVSKVLNISVATLTSDLKAGQSIDGIASKQGISQQKLTTALEADYKQRLDSMVSSGRISSSQEGAMISRYDQSLPKMLSTPGLPSNFGNRPPRSQGGHGQWGGNRTGNQVGGWNPANGTGNSNAASASSSNSSGA